MELSVTVDFPDDVCKGPYDEARFDALMARLAGAGVKRVHWLYYGEVTPDALGRGNIYWSHWAKYGPVSVAALGEPLRAAVRAARQHGLAIHGVLKPYNGGLSGTYPLGSPSAGSTSRLRRVGGSLQQVIPFLEARPELRLQRRPGPRHHAPIAELILRKSDAALTRLTPAQLRLWVSADNFRYRPLPLVPEGTVTVEPAPRAVRDYHGTVLTRAGDPVRVIRLTGLDLRDPFVVVTTTCTTGPGDFGNTPLALAEARDGAGRRIDTVVATQAAGWIQPRDFRSFGLEFDQGYGHLPVTLDAPWHGAQKDPWQAFAGEDEFAEQALLGRGAAGGFVGLAVGTNEHLAAVPCEAYPEVRALWLGWIDAMLAAGVDGVDLRVSAHGCLSDEPEAYGWNPPVLAACAARFGAGEPGPAEIAAVRGDLYSEFVHAASARVRAAGRKMQVHLHAEAFRPDPVFGQRNGVPANLDFQWRRWLESGWVDGVTLRTSWFEGAEDPLGAATRRGRLVAALADSVAAEMLAIAGRRRLPVILNRYIGRAATLAEYLDDLESVVRDGRFAGFDVYEFFDLAHADPAGPGFVERKGRLAGLSERWRKLGFAGG